MASTMVKPTTTSSIGMTENIIIQARPKHTPDSGHLPPIQKGLVSVREIPSTTEHRVMSPVSTGHILGEGAAIFTDMTETMLTALDQQMALSDEAQKTEGSLLRNLLVPGQVSSHGNIEESKTKPLPVTKAESKYQDLYLLVAEIYKISIRFYGYMDSMSADGNPMILVELTALSSLAKSIPITQSSHMPAISDTLPPISDILEPASNEQVRSTYLERQMRQMGSINRLPPDMPSLEDGIVQGAKSLEERIQSFGEETKSKGSRNRNHIE